MSTDSFNQPADARDSDVTPLTPSAADQETLAPTASSFSGLVDSSSNSSPPGPNTGRTGAGQGIQVGDTLGRYRIVQVLGSGAMGSVFLAHDTQLDRQVAIKMPRFDHNATEMLALRLNREARAAAVLNHPNICPIHDVAEHGGSCFIAMGYVSGKPLSAYIESRKIQPERESAKVIRKVALALHEAHLQGIVHRDLKPTNIMIDKRGEPIVMDFGVACWFEDETQTRLTQEGSLVGTPAYMAPEQIQAGSRIGPAADIYSLGVVLYQLLTGRCPFEGSVLSVIGQVLHQDPPPLTRFRPDLSPAITEICRRAMQKNPTDRYPSMKDFAKALTTFLNDGSSATRSLPSAESPARLASDSADEIPRRRSTPPETVAIPAPELPRLAPRKLTARAPQKTRRAEPAENPNAWVKSVIIGLTAAVLLLLGAVFGPMLTGGRPDSSVGVASAGGDGASSGSSGPSDADTTASPEQPIPDGDAAKIVSPTPRELDVASNVAAPAPASPKTSPPSDPPMETPARIPETAPQPPSRTDAPGAVSNNPAPPSSPGERPDAPKAASDQEPPGPDHQPPPHDWSLKQGTTIEAYFKERDANQDNQLDPTELPLHIVNRADTTKNGKLSLSELRTAFKRRGQKLFDRPTAAELRRMPRPTGPFGPPAR